MMSARAGYRTPCRNWERVAEESGGQRGQTERIAQREPVFQGFDRKIRSWDSPMTSSWPTEEKPSPRG